MRSRPAGRIRVRARLRGIRREVVERKLRLWSGLLFAVFVVLHLSNHALGLVSIEAMERAREWMEALWGNPVMLTLLYGSFAIHFWLALASLLRRTTLRMPAWEGAQLVLGLLVVPLIATHATGTRGVQEFMDIDVDYPLVLGAIWTDDFHLAQQITLLLVVWLHVVVGLHFWLRLRAWYAKAVPYLYAAALLIPVLSLLGFTAAGVEIRRQILLSVSPLIPAGATPAAVHQPGGVSGREQRIVVMFIDLRDSTRLGEGRLPYDVVFILNRFFAEMWGALEETGGHYAQFAGDGLMALYGLESDVATGARQALRGAAEMARRLSGLNAQLAGELAEPLRVGIGIHCGDAIVGTMGPPKSPNLSAVGDNVNVAARLESQSKTLRCTLVVSTALARAAGVDLSGHPLHEAELRGRGASVQVYAIDDPRKLPESVAV